MSKHADHFDEFQPHTLLKHQILNSYIVAWAMKLLMWGGAGEELAVVDAFAGKGHDESGNQGSPVIAARRAAEAIAAVRSRKPGTHPRIQVYAVEQQPSYFAELATTMAPFKAIEGLEVYPLQGSLLDHIDGIVANIDQRPAFFFLDPYGIKGLNASTYSKALAGPHNEIFVLFSDIGAVRLHGLLTAKPPDVGESIAAIRARPSLFSADDDRRVTDLEVAAKAAAEALDASIPASRQHLVDALGGEDWIADIASAPRDRRADRFLGHFRELMLRSGAAFVLSVPMRNDRGRHVYELIHASKSPKAFVTMKEAVSKGLNAGPLPEPARHRMREDLSLNLDSFIEEIRTGLAGETIQWSGDGQGLGWLLLAYSGLFQFQMPEVKKRLKERGFLKRIDRREHCVFPPTDADHLVGG